MKVFISADIEGVTTTTEWDETINSKPSYPLHAKQMTEEVLACVRGAKKAGAKEIFVKDAHYLGNNIDPTRMPSGVTLLRNWSGHPYCMAEGIDRSFDAAMFVGYHSASGKAGNPMAHTMSSSSVNTITINGIVASEFFLYSLACTLENVPTVFLSGDKALCEDSKELHPKLITCPVKDGVGAMTINYSPEDTMKSIEELSEKALAQDLTNALPKLPSRFEVEIEYKKHQQAEKASWFPGVRRKSDYIIEFGADSFFEVLRTVNWVL